MTRPTTTLPPTTKLPNAVDDVARVAVQQDQARDGDVDREPEQRGEQQQARERGEVERARHVERRDDDHQRRGDVQRDREVEQERRQRDDHHHDDQHDRAGGERGRRDGRASSSCRSCGGAPSGRAVDVGEQLGHGLEELLGDHAPDVDRGVERAGERRVGDDGDAGLAARARGCGGRRGPGPWRPRPARARRRSSAGRRRSASGW